MDGNVERFETVVVGGGQAGLVVGYHLAKAGRDFVILDASERVGDVWRNRWDSLRLFTPARYDGLPGMRFPASGGHAPTKDEMADYVAAYAERFSLPVRSGVRVDRLSRNGDGYELTAGDHRYESDDVVIATGAFGSPRVPAFARELDPSIVQLHSSEYRNPSQLRDGGVLVVGSGNSGGEISIEVVQRHPTWLSGRPAGVIPVRIDGFLARNVLVRGFRFAGTHVLTLRTPIGRKVAKKIQAHGDPLVRVKPKDLDSAGVERVPRTVGARDGLPVLEDGRVLDVTNVIWCTGSRQDLSWVDLPIFGEDGRPVHWRGVAAGAPGIYFVGLHFQYAEASSVLPGMPRDARYVARHLLGNARSRPSPTERQPSLAARSER